MGSWDKTCALTGLPIFEGEDAYAFFVSESKYPSKSDTNALYTAVPLPFKCTYADYGRGSNCGPTFALAAEAAGLGQEFINSPDKVFESIHDGSLAHVEIAMIKQSACELALRYRTVLCSDEKVRWGMACVIDDQLSELKKLVKGEINTSHYFQKWLTQENMYDVVINVLNDTPHLTDVARMIDRHMLTKFTNKLGRFWEWKICGQDALSIHIPGLISSPETLPLALEVLQGLIIGVSVDSFMQSTRKVWLPSMFEGSQFQELKPYEDLKGLLDDFIYECRREEEWWEEEEENLNEEP